MSPRTKHQGACLVVEGEAAHIDGAGDVEDTMREPLDGPFMVHNQHGAAFQALCARSTRNKGAVEIRQHGRIRQIGKENCGKRTVTRSPQIIF